MPTPLRTYRPDISRAINRLIEEPPVAQSKDEANYFANNHPPNYLTEIANQLNFFLKDDDSNSKIVLVTSGGTTVPLENNTIRFIDNFSAGTRGSISAEQFLLNDYKVIFLYREFSFMPFLRHFTSDPNKENFLEYLEKSNNNELKIKPKYSKKLSEILNVYDRYKRNLLTIPFTTVNQYLYSLKLICETLSIHLNPPNIIIYLSAAVSDFYIPESKLPNHKIQSSTNEVLQTGNIKSLPNGGINIKLSPVPKFLNRIVDSWCPGSFVISFKLETDESLLLNKCISSLKKYHQNLVIGNLLQTRKNEIMFVFKKLKEDNDYQSKWYKLKDDEETDIENKFIPIILKYHDDWINQ